MKLILATANPHKIQKLTWVCQDYFDEITPQDSLVEVEENGATFRENAELKALAVSKYYHTYAVATDGGVLIPSLGDSWNGLFTKRFVGRNDATDFDRMDALLEMMKDKRGKERAIVWNEAIALAYDGKLVFSQQVEGDRGMVQTTYNPSQYRPGIWQCTLTCYPQFGGKNFFELNEEEQKYAEISWHRLKDALATHIGTHPLLD